MEKKDEGAFLAAGLFFLTLVMVIDLRKGSALEDLVFNAAMIVFFLGQYLQYRFDIKAPQRAGDVEGSAEARPKLSWLPRTLHILGILGVFAGIAIWISKII